MKSGDVSILLRKELPRLDIYPLGQLGNNFIPNAYISNSTGMDKYVSFFIFTQANGWSVVVTVVHLCKI